MNPFASTELKDDELSMINEFINKINELNKNKTKSSLFKDSSVAKIVNTTINEFNLNKNSAIMPLVNETINTMICNFTQSYPDIPMNKESDSNDDIKPETLVLKSYVDNESSERCFNLIENPIVIPSDDSEKIIFNYTCEYNPVFKELTNETSELLDKPKSNKIKIKSGTKEFHLVLNVGFGYGSKGVIFQCFSGYCNFKSYDRNIFEAHFEKCHYVTTYEGICKHCEKMLNILNISQELNHIYECHMTEASKHNKDDALSEATELLPEISDVNSVFNSQTDKMIDSEQIDELIKMLEDTNDTPISSETEIAVEDKSLMSQVTSPQPITTEMIPETTIEIQSSENEVSKSSVSTTIQADSVEIVPVQEIEIEIKNERKISLKKSSKKSLKRLRFADAESVDNKKYKTDEGSSERPTTTATTKNLCLRVSLERLSEETIAKYKRIRKGPGRPKKTAHSNYKEPFTRDKSMNNKDLNPTPMISHKSIKITKKTIPTVFKRSLSLNRSRSENSPKKSEIIPERSALLDESEVIPDQQTEKLKLKLKKCVINENETGSQRYEVLNQTNGSMEAQSDEKMIKTKTRSSERTEKVIKCKSFDEALLILDEPIKLKRKYTKRQKLSSVDKTPISESPLSPVSETDRNVINENETGAEQTEKVEKHKIPKRKSFDEALLILDEPIKLKRKYTKRQKLSSVDKTPISEITSPIYSNGGSSSTEWLSTHKKDPVECNKEVESPLSPVNETDRNVINENETESPLSPVNETDRNVINENETGAEQTDEPIKLKRKYTKRQTLYPVDKTPISEITSPIYSNGGSSSTEWLSTHKKDPVECNKEVESPLSPVTARIGLLSPPTPVFDTNEASKSAVIEKDSDEESTTTAKDLNSELHSTRKPSDENNNDSPSQIEEQSISELVNHEEVKPKSPLNSNGKQSSIVILEDIMLSTLPNEINSPQSPNTSTSTTVIPPIIFPTPTNGHVLPATHINFSLLQPWLNKRSHNKYAISCHTQLQKNGLRAKYRCMGSTCSFYTSEKGLYRLHLKRHIHNENNNIDTFLYCSNCIYSTNDIDKLVNHVTIVHRFDRYQCPYCFYRSVEKQSCLTHVEKYHRYNEKCIMECPIDDTPTNAEKLRDKLHAYRLKHVAPFRCPICTKCYFLGGPYIMHIKTHDEINDRPIIQKTILLLQKLMDDNHYGLNQCLYCVYGSKTEDEMRVHLSNCHPSEYTYYCKREASVLTNISAEFLESTQLIKLGQEHVKNPK